MPKTHEIELFISDDGELKVHIKGMKGPACLKILDTLSKEVGPEKERTLTPEYYEKPETGTGTSTDVRKM